MSPAVLRKGPYRFYFVSHDLHEPPHVHIDRDSFFSQILAQSCGFGLQSRVSSKGTEEIGNTHFKAPEGIIGGME